MSRTIKSTTGLSRQFLNLIVAHSEDPGIKSLRFMNLKREQLFNPTPLSPTAPTDGDRSESTTLPQDATSQAPPTESLVMEKIRLSGPSFQFQSCNSQGLGWNIGCFPLSDLRVLCMDQSGLNFLFDGVTRHIVTMPILHIPKRRPISLFIPSTDVIGGGSLFLMDSAPRVNSTVEFESLVYRKTSFCNTNSWQGQLLPPPPYAHDPSYWTHRSEISSYAVVGGGSHICISVKDVCTYCLDTTSYTWSQAGKWTLPFSGKVEYVPEFKLWFGLSADGQQLAAADLSFLSNVGDSSAQDFQPEVLGPWMELTLPEGWNEREKAQLVNLGSGRFCVSRFFRTITYDDSSEAWGHKFSVLTGVEMVPLVYNVTGNAVTGGSGDGSKGKIKLQMIRQIKVA